MAEVANRSIAQGFRKCCEGGMTDVEVAKMLGIGLATLYRWKVEHPAFSRVFKLGKAKADDRVERSLYNRAVGYDYIAEKAVMTRHGQKTMRYRQHIPPALAPTPISVFRPAKMKLDARIACLLCAMMLMGSSDRGVP
jgi:hypothetical protein